MIYLYLRFSYLLAKTWVISKYTLYFISLRDYEDMNKDSSWMVCCSCLKGAGQAERAWILKVGLQSRLPPLLMSLVDKQQVFLRDRSLSKPANSALHCFQHILEWLTQEDNGHEELGCALVRSSAFLVSTWVFDLPAGFPKTKSLLFFSFIVDLFTLTAERRIDK